MDYISTAGALAWPVLAISAVALLFALRHFATGRQRDRQLALGGIYTSGFLALVNGVLGFQFASRPVVEGHAQADRLFMLGLSETLNGLVIALTACFLVAAVLTLARLRTPPSETAA